MALKKKKTISLYRLFLKYLIGLSGALIVLIITVIFLLSFAFQLGILRPANYTDSRLNQLEETLQQNFDKHLLPLYSHYIIIDTTGQIVESTMSDKNIQRAKDYLLTGNRGYSTFYKQLVQDNGNILLIQYDMLAHFRDPRLHYWIPYPELFIVIFVLGSILLFAVITALKFSKTLKNQLDAITHATEKIQHQDLDFDINPTRIVEFNAILSAIDDLKSSLSASLKEQWNKEQQKKAQLSALTHDIKTPLTIIKGNADLLAENSPSEDDQELIGFIQSGTDNIEKYLALLMDVTNDQSIRLTKQLFILQDFLHDFKKDALPLCKTKNITFNLDRTFPSYSIYADPDLLKRALMNILDNAVHYSTIGSSIECTMTDNNTSITFHIKDYGKGFTKISLMKATEEFYTEDTSRSHQHYGLGLSFAANIAKMHDGSLDIKNNIDTTGSVVSFTLARNDR